MSTVLSVPPRRRLDAIAGRLAEDSLLTVVAPGGYGKSALLTRLADQARYAVARVSVTPSSAAADDLARAIAAAVARRRSPDRPAAHSAHPAQRPPGQSTGSPDHVLRRGLGRTQAMVILDDVHHVSDPEAHALLETLLLDDDLGRPVVLAGRWLPPLRWNDIRAARTALALDAHDLAVRVDDLVEEGSRTGQGRADVRSTAQRIVAQTWGWPTAVAHHVGALSTSTDPSQAEERAKESLRRHLESEVFPRVDPEALAILEDAAATGPLPWQRLQAVRAGVAAGEAAGGAEHDQPDSRRPTSMLEAATVEVPAVDLPSDPDRPVRIAPTLRAILFQRLVARDPSRAQRLTTAALEVLEQQGEPLDALELATRAGLRSEVQHLLWTHGPTLAMQGHSAPVEAALDLLPTAEVADDLMWSTLRGHVAASKAVPDELAYWLDIGDQRRPADVPRWSPIGSGPSDLVRRLFDIGVTTQPNQPSDVDVPMPWVGLHNLVRAMDLIGAGDIDHARGVLAASAPVTRDQPLIDLQRAALLAAVCTLSGREREANDALAEAERRADTIAAPGDPRRLLLDHQLAHRALARGDTASAAHWMDTSLAGIRSAGPWLGLPRLLAASSLLGLAAQLGRPDLAAQLQAHLGPSAAPAAAPSPAPAPDIPLTASERRVLTHLAGTASVPGIAADLHLSPSTVRAHTRAIFAKLRVSSRAEAVARGQQLGLLPRG